MSQDSPSRDAVPHDSHDPARKVHLSRRGFLAGLAAVPVAYALTGRSADAAETAASTISPSPASSPVPGAAAAPAVPAAPATPNAAGFLVRGTNPDNLEPPFSTLDTFLTPNDKFYIRSHFPVPTVDAGTWRLKVGGAVGRPVEFSLDDLMKLPAETRAVTLECAGNGRSLLDPKVEGVQWALGAVGTAEWTGVPLAALLEKAGLKDSAVEIVLEGADGGTLNKPSKPEGTFPFARSLSLAKARDGGVLLAYRMNGEPLTAAHGAPLRAVVPGHYGMASVKWLTRIVAVEKPFHGFFQSVDYTYWQTGEGGPSREPVADLQVKAQIARPAAGKTVAQGSPYKVAGFAWTGTDATIEKVEVSTDGGARWTPARLLGTAVPGAWRQWEYTWNVPAKGGKHTLLARATDSQGRVQAATRDRNRLTYMISHIIPVEVTVA